MRLARMLQAAARPMGAMARPSGPLPVATTGARSAVPWNGQGGHSTWHRRWSAAAATDVEYRDRPNQQPVPPIAHGTTRLETLVDPGSLFKVRLGWGIFPVSGSRLAHHQRSEVAGDKQLPKDKRIALCPQ